MRGDRTTPSPDAVEGVTLEEASPSALAELLRQVDAPKLGALEAFVPAAPQEAPQRATAAARVASAETSVPALRTARVCSLVREDARIAWRDGSEPISAQVASDVDLELVKQALEQQERVLVECAPGEAPLIVGVVHSRIPQQAVLRGQTVRIEADEEILLRTGRGAFRIRKDGTLELVGNRIVATSRGLFRLIGRVLRLN